MCVYVYANVCATLSACSMVLVMQYSQYCGSKGVALASMYEHDVCYEYVCMYMTVCMYANVRNVCV